MTNSYIIKIMSIFGLLFGVLFMDMLPDLGLALHVPNTIFGFPSWSILAGILIGLLFFFIGLFMYVAMTFERRS